MGRSTSTASGRPDSLLENLVYRDGISGCVWLPQYTTKPSLSDLLEEESQKLISGVDGLSCGVETIFVGTTNILSVSYWSGAGTYVDFEMVYGNSSIDYHNVILVNNTTNKVYFTSTGTPNNVTGNEVLYVSSIKGIMDYLDVTLEFTVGDSITVVVTKKQPAFLTQGIG